MNVKKIICAGVFALSLITLSLTIYTNSNKAKEETKEPIMLEEETKEPVIVSRESWSSIIEGPCHNGKINLTCTSIIYNDNTVDILIQNNDCHSFIAGPFTFQSIQFNDFLYNDPIYIFDNKYESNNISELMDSNWNTIEKYINNNKIIDLKFNINNSYAISLEACFKLLLRFKPIIPFDEKTEIIVNDHVIVIN